MLAGLKKSITLKSKNQNSSVSQNSKIQEFDKFLFNVCKYDNYLMDLNKWFEVKLNSSNFIITKTRIHVDSKKITDWICSETKKTGNDKYYIFVNTEKYKTTNDINDLFENNDPNKVFIQRFNVSSGNVEQEVLMHDFNDPNNIKSKKLWELICANIS